MPAHRSVSVAGPAEANPASSREGPPSTAASTRCLLVGGFVFFIGNLMGSFQIAGVIAVVAMFVLLSFEAWLGVQWLGKRFEGLDISSELRP